MDKKYWEDLNKFPPLNKNEEAALFKKASAGNKIARDTIINSNLRFVIEIAKEYEGQGLEFEDLVSYGNLGLCRAYEKFDSTRNIKFITYAVWWIRQAILQALNEDTHMIRVPHYKAVSKNTVEKTKEKLEHKHQREITTAEIEDELGKEISNSFDYFSVISLDKVFTGDTKTTLGGALKDPEGVDPELRADHESFLKDLNDLLSDFTEREKNIIKYYHGMGIVRNLTLEEIGLEFGITRERVRQIKEKVLKRLRHKSKKEKLKPYLAILQSEILHDISNSKQQGKNP